MHSNRSVPDSFQKLCFILVPFGVFRALPEASHGNVMEVTRRKRREGNGVKIKRAVTLVML